MAGIAGSAIALNVAQSPIGGAAQVILDANDDTEGCLENFIGFGLGAASIPQREDFNVTDDTVTLGDAAGTEYEPTYTLGVLTWDEPVVTPP